jgi:DNA-binding NarL/FixJ family response regulator
MLGTRAGNADHDETAALTAQIRVLLVDDHPAVLMGLTHVLNAAPDVVVVGAERDGERGLAAFIALQPEVVVMDVSMPGENGLDVMRRMLDHAPETTVLVLTAVTDDRTLASALDGGAGGYLSKECDSSEVVRAVQASARGEMPVGSRPQDPAQEAHDHDDEPLTLTPREREVLELLLQGRANKQIAERLGVGESTVKSHLRKAFERIGVNDRTSAALWAQRHLHQSQ